LIHRNFREPNYRCKVTDYKGDSHEWLTYASSEDELRQRLEAQDLAVAEIKAYDFEQWKDRAAGARRTAVEAHDSGQPINFNSNLWGELKLHLFELFDGKCAYCEARVLHVAWGDVEHYRPKRAVLEDDTHPGYYWLAYDTDNLLPCCPKCNEARGKQTHFPIKAGGQRAYDEQAERPERKDLHRTAQAEGESGSLRRHQHARRERNPEDQQDRSQKREWIEAHLFQNGRGLRVEATPKREIQRRHHDSERRRDRGHAHAQSRVCSGMVGQKVGEISAGACGDHHHAQPDRR
jgi:hypothetical protein